MQTEKKSPQIWDDYQFSVGQRNQHRFRDMGTLPQPFTGGSPEQSASMNTSLQRTESLPQSQDNGASSHAEGLAESC